MVIEKVYMIDASSSLDSHTRFGRACAAARGRVEHAVALAALVRQLALRHGGPRRPEALLGARQAGGAVGPHAGARDLQVHVAALVEGPLVPLVEAHERPEGAAGALHEQVHLHRLGHVPGRQLGGQGCSRAKNST